MISRGTLIAGLIVVELAILGEIVVAIQGGGQPAPPYVWRTDAEAAPGSQLIDGGPHQTFAAGAHPELTVDIGYADLTIVAANVPRIDISVSRGGELRFLRSTAPIAAQNDGDTISITTSGGRRWSTGDDRMVTVLVPPETKVTVINAGDIKAKGLRAEASFNSIGSGDVTIEDYDAPALSVATSNGRITLREVVATHLDATSRNDRVDAAGLRVRDGKVESDDHVNLGFATGSDALVNAETDDGKVYVSGLSAAAWVVTGKSNGGSDDDSSSQTVRVGAGDGRFYVHTSDGNINLNSEN